MRTLGAWDRGEGTEFSVWAPSHSAVSLEVEGRRLELRAAQDGTFSVESATGPGADYWFVVDDRRRPDPCSRWQPEGLRGPSRVLASHDVVQHVAVPLTDLVLYELHVGTFTREGTFDAAAARLPALAAAGITAVELMPVATFPGTRGWGYDGVLTSAPHVAYGGPAGLARFVSAAHEAGLAVVLDVVYNHIGPGSELVSDFGPYFTDRYDTPWGDALDYRREGVREWAIQNAELWVREYGVDGLRLDAIHAIHDDSPVHVLAELATRVRAVYPEALVISETGREDRRPLDDWGHDAIWLDSLHHHLHVILTGERDGYYGDFGTIEGVVRELTRRSPERFVVAAQNHDQVGNRAFGDRLTREDHRIALAVVLFSTATPLVFMGEEYDETRPFLYFTDHDDPAIATATRKGRRREFGAFADFASDIPDPQAPETFDRSKLEPREWDPLYRKLLELRYRLPRRLEALGDGSRLTIRRGETSLLVDFTAKTLELRA